MDENLAWKIVYAAALFSFLVVGIAYYFMSTRTPIDFSTEMIEKMAELKNAHIEGRKEGKKSWEFYADNGWTARDRETTYLFNVNNGYIYKEGVPTVSGLKAPRVKINSRTELIEAYGRPDDSRGPSALIALLDLSSFSDQEKQKSDWTWMNADHIKYITKEKRSELSGNVTLSKKGRTIKADKINVDHEKKIADMFGKVFLKRKDINLQSDTMQYLGQNEQMIASGNLSIKLKDGKILTSIRCDRATFFDDQDKDIMLAGELNVTQGKKIAIGKEGIYSKREKGLLIKGDTKTVIEKAEAVLKQETATKLKNPEAKTILKKKTMVIADEIFFSSDTSNARASGNVLVTQKEREASANYAFYDDNTEQLRLTGDVHIKKPSGWIRCKEVVVSVPKETFQAFGEVEAEFKL